jgi:hypothetical protein
MRETVIAALLALGLSGCGGPNFVRVVGVVTFDDQPVTEGLIEFIPVDDTRGPSTGGMIANGRYDVPALGGPQAGGTYQVVITATCPLDKTAPNPISADGIPVQLMEMYIPDQYNTQSTLKVTIPRVSPASFDFALVSPTR